MKFNISKEWIMDRVHLEDGVDFNTGIPPDAPALDWARFPIKEMFQRKWFKDFAETLAEAKAQANTLVQEYIKLAVPRPVVSLQRQRVRTGADADPFALLAWQCRVLLLAKSNAPRIPYRNATLNDEWLAALVQLSQFADGPLRAQRYLRAAGIPLVIEPHLSSTHLDGAALLGEHGPVIGLTLRHDRLDNFWFVLLHEIVHVKKHLRKGSVEDIFDDLDVAANDIEHEADSLAAQALIPEAVWETALPRFVRSEEAIRDFAAQLKISPAIVAGRIRREAENYTLLNELVGRGAVRKFFAATRSG